MRRLKISEPDKTVLEEAEAPVPGRGEVLIRVAYCGICGSDIHAFKGKHPFIPLPATPGHEFSGTIEKIGDGVSAFSVGDRVVCEPNLVCGACYNCTTGRYNICESLRVMGCQGEGAMADYIAVPVGKAIHIPDRLSLRDAVLVEPLAVGVHAVRKGGDLFGRNVVIIGAGTIGLMVLVCAAKSGAGRVVVTDLARERLRLAARLGASGTVEAGTGMVDRLLDGKPYEGYEVVFECVGVEKSIRDAMVIVRKGGRIVVCGVFGSETRVRMADVQDRELELVGTLMYTRRDVTDAVGMLAGGLCPPDLFITGEYTLEEAQRAFAAAMDTRENVKVIFRVSPEQTRGTEQT